MPKRDDIKTILIVGAGPIIIGQACEFDYSGTQACNALKEVGFRTILINSNPATIMTDPEIADLTYIEPITAENIIKIIKREKPDAILPTMGGQTALNVSLELEKNGSLKQYKVEMIGADLRAIEMAEDRIKFKEAMQEIGLDTAKSKLASNLVEAAEAFENVGLPAIIRPSFTLGGEGGGVAYNKKDFEEICKNGLDLSPVGEVLIEESLIGWKEFEMEVVRDKNDNCIIICSIENIDPMGVHTGDSITVAPALTLTDKELQEMRNASFSVLRKIGVNTGGANVQFAVNPENGRQIIIEMNPRVSRSSALASKATGFPIAKIAALLSVGYTLEELDNDITRYTPASFEPTIDYIVTKIPRFTFEKFPGSEEVLTTSMKSVGEAMSIGRNFKESIQKALRSIENNLDGFNNITPPTAYQKENDISIIKGWLSINSPNKILRIAEAIRLGLEVKEICAITKWDYWFINQIFEIISIEQNLILGKFDGSEHELKALKNLGFSDKRISFLTKLDKKDIYNLRDKYKIFPKYKRIDTCANEFDSKTAYMYGTYEYNLNDYSNCEANPSSADKIIILGGGPNRIGQGIEFDYCCVHASYSLKEEGYETIMINCNPETVSTDYNTSDKLYFEPLLDEDVLEIIKCEKKNGTLKGVIIQFGGQTPLKIARTLNREKIPILGTKYSSIDIAEDRDKFKKVINKLNLLQPKNGICKSYEEARKIVQDIGFPVVIRPSFVLGGRGMEIIYNYEDLKVYLDKILTFSDNNNILIDEYLTNAIEVDVDAICDNKDIYIAGISEHIEEAGIHSGDSACVLPTQNLSNEIIKEIEYQTKLIALELEVVGLINIQFAIKDNKVILIEVNPRASRTVPFIAKSIGLPIAKIAAKVMSGKKLQEFDLNVNSQTIDHVCVKEVVFPFARFPGCKISLGPEMKSTGEVMGIDVNFDKAFAKSQIAVKNTLPKRGNIFISVRNNDKPMILDGCKVLIDIGFEIIATKGTNKYLFDNDIPSTQVQKILEGRPNILDYILSDKIQIIINTIENDLTFKDSMILRRNAVNQKIPYFTSIRGAIAAINSIKSINESSLEIKPLQEYINYLI